MRPLAVLIAVLVAIFTAIALPWWGGLNTWIAWGVGIVTVLLAEHWLPSTTHSVSRR